MFFNKKLRKIEKEAIKNGELIFDSDNNAVINVKATQEEQIFSEYDYDNGEKLNPSLSDYIWDKARFVPVNRDIKLKIYTSEKVNEQEVESAIRSNFKKDYNSLKAEKKKNSLFCLSMFILGLISLAFLFLSYNFFKNDYVDVIVEIVVWVFFWEAVDAFFLQRNEMKHKQIVLLKLFSAQIEVVKIEELRKKK